MTNAVSCRIFKGCCVMNRSHYWGMGNAHGHVDIFLYMIPFCVRGFITTFKDLTSEQKLHLKMKEPTQSLLASRAFSSLQQGGN